ncbi:MAG: N-ethylammeline chlorohydrolase [Beggiatoa sp. IS2]|nr:MAG: N-ethylammeline chlorohydrolase [Beggiatoa sp. IS2]
MHHIDTIIFAGWIIPVEPADTIYEHYALAIHEGKILALLPSSEAVSRFSARVTYRLSNHLLIPGLINTHTHAAMTLLRGFADDMPLQDWLNKRIWPVEQALVSPEFVADGTKLAMVEMLRGGVTCFNDMYFFPDIVGGIAEQVGMRATVGLILLDFPTAWAKDASEYLQKAREVHGRFHHHPLVRTALAPHAPYTVSDDLLDSTRLMAEELDLPIHIHVHETLGEVDDSVAQYGERPLARLHRLGLISPRLLAVHLTQVDNEDINLLVYGGAHAIHCPESNLKLASGFCPVHKLFRANINVALGTDGAASNDDLDMLGEMRTAALLAKGLSKDASSVPASQALNMATINGARALGIEQITGSLVPGKAADIVAIDMSDIDIQPVYNPLSHLVYTVGRDKVTDVWIAGKHLLKSRMPTSLDVHDIRAKTQAWRNKVLSVLA